MLAIDFSCLWQTIYSDSLFLFSMEIFLENDALVSAQTWQSIIHSWQVPETPVSVECLSKEIENVILKRVNQPCGLLFSGGVDSSVIALVLKKNNVDFTCYTVGFQDGGAKMPEDVVESKRAAEMLGLRHKVLMLDLDAMHELVRKTVQILGNNVTVVNVGVGAVEVAALEAGKQDGVTHFFGGLGSEEIFAGYERHALADNINEECIKGLLGMRERDLIREVAIAHALEVQVATPFLDETLAKLALRIPGERKINHEHTFAGRARGDIPDRRVFKKLILREAALALGLPRELAYRPKRAAQYGSRTNNALTMLAKKHGFKHKDDYLRSFSSIAG